MVVDLICMYYAICAVEPFMDSCSLIDQLKGLLALLGARARFMFPYISQSFLCRASPPSARGSFPLSNFQFSSRLAARARSFFIMPTWDLTVPVPPPNAGVEEGHSPS